MREIKFRAWTGSNMEYKVMAGWLGAFYVQGISETDSTSMSYANTKYSETTPLMQYTGLKDKNGKEIYEGDILSWVNPDDYQDKTPELHKVIWYRAGFTTEVKDKGNDYDYIMEEDENWEVIGNIYENSDLLK